MGLTLQQALAQGFKPMAPQQSAAVAAFQAFGKPPQAVTAPTPASPALKDFIATGAAPGAEAAKQGTAANFLPSVPEAVKDALGNAVVKPAADLGVNAYNYGKAGVDLAENGGKPSAQATEDINATRHLPLGIGDIASTDPNHPLGALKVASDSFATLQNALLASDAIKTVPDLPKLLSSLGEKISTAAGKVSDALPDLTPKEPATPTKNLAQEVIKNPADLEQAFNDGRISVKNGKSVIAQSPIQQKMSAALQPLEDAGQLKDPNGIGEKAMNNQLENGAVVQQEIDNQGNQLRSALQEVDAQDKLNAQKTKDYLQNASPTEKAQFYKSVGGKANVKTELSPSSWNLKEFRQDIGPDNVKLPDPVKNEPTMARNAASLQEATAQLAKQVGRNSEDILDLRQNFDRYVKQNYGDSFFEKGRNADPWHKYVFSMRDRLTELAASHLPEGKLPNGQTFQDALQRQHQLINASNEMAAKFANEFKGSETQGTFSRWLKTNPEKARLLRRAGYSAIGVTAVGGLFRKQISSLFSGK